MKFIAITARFGTVAVLLLAGGCSRGVSWLDERDESLPLVQRAAARVTEGDVDSAIRLYRRALDSEPGAAKAHLDLAFLLQDYRKDYVGAIYHYRRYLELRPDAEKQPLIEERIRLAEQLFAADVLGPTRMAARVTSLEKENEVLKDRLQDLSSRILSARRPEGGAATPPRSATPSTPATGGSTASSAAATTVNTYRVKRGDTLSSIASEVYGDDARWKDIQLANTDILGSSTQVRVGQVLVIP